MVEPAKYISIISRLTNIKYGNNYFYRANLGFMDGLHVKGSVVGQVVPVQLSLNQNMVALSPLEMNAPDKIILSSRTLFRDPVVRKCLQYFYKLLDEKIKELRLQHP